MAPWSAAIHQLLVQAGSSRRKAARGKLAPYGAFSQWKTSRRGPSIAVVDRLLVGLGLTWHDWATAIEAAKTQHPIPPGKKVSKRTSTSPSVPMKRLRLV